ncbi:hypothetical protein TNCT_198541, partial [Trichonephila clavata]
MERQMEATYIERIPILRRQKKGCFSDGPEIFCIPDSENTHIHHST